MTRATWFVLGVVIFILASAAEYYEYSIYKRHFPGLTFGEYMHIKDKLRVKNAETDC